MPRLPPTPESSTSPTAPSTPRSGTLLLAATEAGLVRVAYSSEDHDAVLEQLADRVSPRVLRAPARLDPPPPSWRSTSPADVTCSTCRWTCGSRAASGVPSCPISRDRVRRDRQLRGRRGRGRQPQGGPRGRVGLRDEPAAGRRALPPGRAQRRDHSASTSAARTPSGRCCRLEAAA
ncbi:MAG: hypothetical protein WKF47_05095 [Geodermatophilaceae bacterium]